jgi:hypothetical protein
MVAVDVLEERVGWRDSRSVSGRPGAEGAPRSSVSRLLPLLVEESLLAAVLVVLVGCDAAGARRRDCFLWNAVSWDSSLTAL